MYEGSVRVIVVSALLPFLAFLSLLIRGRARYAQRASLNASDWWIIATLIIQIGGSILNIVGASEGGLGAPLPTLTMDEATLFKKTIFGQQFFYITSVATVKISVILFYKGIFANAMNGKFKLISNISMGIITAWWIALFFTTLFQNNPIKFNWEGTGTSINYQAFYLAGAATDIFFDLAILCLPLPVIKSLKLSAKKRWLIVGIFWLGAFCCVCSIVRLYYTVVFKNQNPEVDIAFSDTVVNIVVWSTVEPCVSIITASLPTFGPLLGSAGVDLKRFVYSLYSIISSPLNRSRATDPEASVGHSSSTDHELTSIEGTKRDV